MAALAEAPALDPRSVADYLQEWLMHIRGRVRPKTYAGYEALIRLHAIPGLGHLELQALAPLDCSGCTPTGCALSTACPRGLS